MCWLVNPLPVGLPSLIHDELACLRCAPPSLRCHWRRSKLKAVNSQLCVHQPWCRALTERKRPLCSSRTDISDKPQREVSSDSRMAKNPCAILLAFFLLRNCQQTLVVDPHDLQDKPGSQVKRRLSLQNTGERKPADWSLWNCCEVERLHRCTHLSA